MEGLSIKVAEADADHTVLQCTCGSKGLGKRGAERVKSDRGAYEKGIFEAGSQGWACGRRERYTPAVGVAAVDHWVGDQGAK